MTATNKNLFFISALLLGTLSMNCQAETNTQNFALSLSVEPECNVTVQDINFGLIDLINNVTDFEARNNISLTCVKNTPYQISISPGGAGNMENGRTLRHVQGYDTISYNIFSSGLQIIGDGSSGTQQIFGKGTGNQEQIPIIAKIKAKQSATPGIYQDRLIITVSY